MGKLKELVGSKIKINVIPKFELFSKDNFGIYACRTEDGEKVTIKGNFIIPIELMNTYEVNGVVGLYSDKKNPNEDNISLTVNSIKTATPKGEINIVRYLTTLKGLNKKAVDIYDMFGDKSIEVIKKDPKLLSDKIKGISLKRAKEWQLEINEKEVHEEDMLYLLELGLTINQANRLRATHSKNIRKVIKDNPYILMDTGEHSYGFGKCDDIAKKMNFDFTHIYRIRASIRHCLKQAALNGHTYLPLELLIEETKKVLGFRMTFIQMRKQLNDKSLEYQFNGRIFEIDLKDLEKRMKKIDSLKKDSAKEIYRYPLLEFSDSTIITAIEDLAISGEVSNVDQKVALSKLNSDEKSIAENILRLTEPTDWKVEVNIEKELEKYLKENDIELELQQKEAVLTFAKDEGNVYALIGSAGTGKTFTLKIILALLEKVYKQNGKDFNVKVLSPTGKAAKIASIATGYEAMTVHRGLEYNQSEGFLRDFSNPLEANLIVVDETSMLDVPLANSLLNAISTGTKVIFLGDIKQLQSVGAGSFLRDILEDHNVITKVILNVIKRQGLLSGLTKNANEIIDGKMISSCDDTKDAFVINEEDDEVILRKTLGSIQNLLKKDGFTMDEIQVLSPQKAGTIGVYELNKAIQSYFNPDDTCEKLRNVKSDKVELYFKKGDKVIHIKNNKDKEWYGKNGNHFSKLENTGVNNGETGIIEGIYKIKKISETGKESIIKRMIVKYDNLYVFYDDDGDDLLQIDHGFCLTIHKSQGSQWKALVLPISKQHGFFLDRNLIYTGWTRAREFAVAIGSKRTIAISISKDNTEARYTQLADFLREAANKQIKKRGNSSSFNNSR